jgi:acetyl-CoA carboxylase biotin carboxylase subunit
MSNSSPTRRPFKKLLVANRSEIALRVIRSAREAGLATVAIYSEPDRSSLHVGAADEAVALDGSAASETYLAVDKILAAAKATGADAIHPGYGFLAENADFAAAVRGAGLCFIGPEADAIRTMGDKIRARAIAEKAGVPVIPSAELQEDDSKNRAAAEALGLPVVVKAAAGGGGRGMRRVDRSEDLEKSIASAKREAGSAFGDSRVYLEKFLVGPRHIEVQVFGDGRGGAVTLGERECSIQRRHQKIVEEAPSPAVNEDLRERMCAVAKALTSTIAYEGAGTVEFVVDDEGGFYFLEMNTRLQVEHAVTEATRGIDLVRWQLDIAAGGQLVAEVPPVVGHAIECRIYAEDPENGFLPTAGSIQRWLPDLGPGIRWDTAISEGFHVPVEYDPMIAKVVAYGCDRPQAIQRMRQALTATVLLGIRTNQSFLAEIIATPEFAAGSFKTDSIDQNWKQWQASDDRAASLAAAVAALVAERGVGASTGNSGTARVLGPWENLGGWRNDGGAS